MKRILFLLFLCSSAWAQPPNVVVSMQPHFALVQQLGGDVNVTRILPLGASPHTFDPSPRDVLRIAEADLVILNGGIDEWLRDLVTAAGTDAKVVELLGVLEFDPITGETHKDAQNEAQSEDNPGGVNPHIWLDPLLMAQAAPKLATALAEIDPNNTELYIANAHALMQNLEALNTELTQTLAPVKNAPFVPFHDAWPYFVRRYGLNQVAVIEPAPGREPSPSYLAEVLGQISNAGTTAIFNDAQLPARPAEIVAESAGVALYTLDPEGGGAGEAETYEALMRRNADTIAQALAPSSP